MAALPPRDRWLNATTYCRNRAVLAVSTAVADSVGKHGVDHGAFSRGSEARARGRAVLGLPDDVPVIGTVGNLTAKKDQRSLLRRPDARLTSWR